VSAPSRAPGHCHLPRSAPAEDGGDVNRTSPFAFTGNTLEFRAVGRRLEAANAKDGDAGSERALRVREEILPAIGALRA
jgi:hypothetical protein